MMKSTFLLTVSLLILVMPILGACAGPGGKEQTALTLAPESSLPDFVKDAPPQVKEAYRFAIANPDVLSAFPCYCGCGAVGHQNNLQCYIKDVRSDGSIEFEDHAFG
jgi:hypothetical protein